MGLTVDRDLPIRGHFKLSLFDADSGRKVGEREADNLIVTGGLNLLAQALNWSFIQNQNTSWGSPYSSLPNLGDAWGACGTSNTAASSAQSGLVSEIGRSIVSNSAVSGAQISYDFFLGTTQGNGAIAELGMFSQAGMVTTSLTTGLTNGQSGITALNVNALALPPAGSAGPSAITAVPNGGLWIIGYGSAQTQVVTANGGSTNGNTGISVNSFTANAAYPAGTPVVYLYGTMIDRTVITPITKTSSETGILEVTLTLISG